MAGKNLGTGTITIVSTMTGFLNTSPTHVTYLIGSGGFKMAGAGVWASTTPGATVIPTADDPLTGFSLGGEGVWAEGPPAFEIEDEVAFLFCGPGTTGDPATAYPLQTVIEAEGGFLLGGAGVWAHLAPDLFADVLVGSGGFALGGAGLATDPGTIPAGTALVGTGGFKMGGHRAVPVEVAYPTDVSETVGRAVNFEMAGEGLPVCTYPESTVIETLGGFLALGGAGLCTSKMPPSMLIVTGESGFVLGGGIEELYEAWVLSGQAFEPSVFSGFNFNSFAHHLKQTFAAGEDGIYLLDGDTDDGETIHTGARIGPINFGSDREKRIRGIQFGNGGPNTQVRVRSESGVGVFIPERDDNRVVVSRDIQGREFTIDILDFQELSQFEAVPLRLARR